MCFKPTFLNRMGASCRYRSRSSGSRALTQWFSQWLMSLQTLHDGAKHDAPASYETNVILNYYIHIHGNSLNKAAPYRRMGRMAPDSASADSAKLNRFRGNTNACKKKGRTLLIQRS